MKLTTILMFTALVQIHAVGLSQNITLSEQNAPLKKVLREIKRQTGYSFFYEDQLLEKSRPVSVNIKNQPLDLVLSTIFRNQPLTYEILDKVIALKAKMENPVSLSPTIVLTAPIPIRIAGTIKDENGIPLEGASISIKNTATATVSKADGTFEIDVVSENAVLVISYVGYVTREIVVGSNRNLEVVLLKRVSQMEQLVVVGYGTQKKKDLTGSITSVRGDEVSKMPSTNPVSSLQGKVPGLTISNSGRAGSSPVVRVRGVNSTTNADPVYVVDGLFVDNIDYLNPSDIESIDILKDASSTAIYGLRAANGVIAITTKKAAKGRTRVSLQSSLSLQKVQDKIALTDAAGFKKLFQAQELNLNVPVSQRFDFTNYTANTNWQDLNLRTAVMTSNNISISNSGEKSVTYLNIGYTNQEGVIRNDQYERYLLHLKEEISVNKSSKVGGDITGYYANFNPPAASITHGLWAAPIFPVQYDEATFYSPPSFQRGSISNPVATLLRNDRTSVNNSYRVTGNLFAEIKFLNDFTWRSTVYGNLNFYTIRSYSRLPYHFISLGEGTTPVTTTYDNNARTSVSQQQGDNRRFQQDHYLTFDKKIGDHSLTTVAGVTTIYNKSSVVDVTAKDTSLFIPNNPDLWYLGVVTSPVATINNGSGGENALFGSFLRTAYSYKGRYLLNATVRRDGSSKFDTKNKWVTSGSIGLGWVISQEDFFSKIEAIDFLKLRAAWGQLANSNGIPDNLFRPGLQKGAAAIFGDNVYPSIVAAYKPDPNLHYEMVGGFDAGFDIRLLRNRLSAEVSLYNKTTKDILTSVTLPGLDIPYYTNLGKITNKGIEINTGWNDKMGKDFSYSVSANFSYNKNVVNAIGDGFDYQITGNGGINLTKAGSSIGYFYGYKQVGIYQSSADLAKHPALPTSLPGDIAYADLNGDGIISPADRTYLGSPFPAYSFGGTLTLGFKGFDLLVEGQGQAGHKIYVQRRTANFTTLNFEANRLNAWTGAGTSNIEPILDNSRGNNFLMSTYYLEPGDYFRVRTLQLGYSFSRRLLSKTGLQIARIYVSGQNLKTWSQVTGYSPEPLIGSILGGGADNGSYPVPAVYSVGLNLTF